MNINGGTNIAVDDLVREIISCKRLFFDGGGVTFTGGECTLQKDSLTYVLTKCKENGIHTAIETNGTCPYEEDLFGNVDLIISDFKHYDEEKLSDKVGAVSGYKENVSAYLKTGKPVRIRIILINNFNSTKSDAENFARFFSSLPTENTEFEFLPYHEYGKTKWLKLGRTYSMENAFVTQETVKTFEKTFADYKLKTIRS